MVPTPHGTVLASFAHELPVVCLPLSREQPDNAAAVERVGAGVALTADASASEIVAAVNDVLGRPSYARQAREMQRLIAAGPAAIDELLASAGLEPTAS